jgi:hypothetical protein
LTLGAHLDRASPAVRQTVEAIQVCLTRIGPHALVPVKTMILLRSSANFGALVVRRDAVHVEFVLSRPIEHPRIGKRQPYGPRRHSHHVRLTSPHEVDAELAGWLRESYCVVVEPP